MTGATSSMINPLDENGDGSENAFNAAAEDKELDVIDTDEINELTNQQRGGGGGADTNEEHENIDVEDNKKKQPVWKKPQKKKPAKKQQNPGKQKQKNKQKAKGNEATTTLSDNVPNAQQVTADCNKWHGAPCTCSVYKRASKN